MDFKALQRLTYGLYVLTTEDEGRKAGCTVNAVMQITNEPITVAVSVNRENQTNEVIAKSGKFGISILAEDGDSKLIGKFGFMSGKNKDKFEGVDIFEVDDLPILKESCGYITCKVIDKLEASTHTIFLGEVITYDIEGVNKEKPVTYEYYHRVLKGKAPKTAPTFVNN